MERGGPRTLGRRPGESAYGGSRAVSHGEQGPARQQGADSSRRRDFPAARPLPLAGRSEFLDQREQPDGLAKIFRDYQSWLKTQSWYHSETAGTDQTN